MELKDFQVEVLKNLDQYIRALRDNVQWAQDNKQHVVDASQRAWHQLGEQGALPLHDVLDSKKMSFNDRGTSTPWVKRCDGLGNSIPNVCLKLPTGGGKTLLGVHAVGRLFLNYLQGNTGLVVWMVPTESIYRQSLNNFTNRQHPYRKNLELLFGRRVKILEKNSKVSRLDLQSNMCIMLLMLQSANRETKESLKMFQDTGRFLNFFPNPIDAEANRVLLKKIPNLDHHNDGSGGNENKAAVGNAAWPIVKHSLGNVLRVVRPVVVLDEGHRAYSPQAVDTVSGLNPRFILELSATPNMKQHRSNVLVDVGGMDLKREQMIKLPINLISTEKGDWKNTLCQAVDKLQHLHKVANKFRSSGGNYIRPIMLIQVERTHDNQKGSKFIHSDDVKQYLIEHLNVPPQAVRLKTSHADEIKDDNLLSPTSPVQYIITHKALQEGWDCSFAYVLTVLSQAKSKQALTQLIGRVLRQPYARTARRVDVKALGSELNNPFADLNQCYVFCYNRVVQDVVTDIQKALQSEGLGDAEGQIITPASGMKHVRSERRHTLKDESIFLPRVLHKQGHSWRELKYEPDILQKVKYSDIESAPMHRHILRSFATITADHIQVDISNRHLPTTASGEELAIDLMPDMALMLRQLCNTVPNPAEAMRILNEMLAGLQAQGLTKTKIYNNRGAVLHLMAEDIKKQVNQQAEQIFKQKLKDNDIVFKLFHDNMNINWEMGTEIDFAAVDDDTFFTHRKAAAAQLSLFDMLDTNKFCNQSLFKIYRNRDFNQFEKQVAWYLDEDEAIKWWHRMAARRDYGLQGWQKQKVWPDFLACSTHGGKKYMVLETKGRHLEGNPDTEYKQKLFNLLLR